MSYSSGPPIYAPAFYPPVQAFDPRQTVLAGMTPAQLQVLLSTAQTAYTQLMVGGKPVTVAYSQGDGSKSVTFNMASAGNLQTWISMLQKALGLPGMSRRPMRPVFSRW